MDAEIDGPAIRTPVDFHRAIARALQFPGDYGHNLDALWDVLAGSLERPVRLRWRHSSDSKKHLGREFERIVEVLRAVETEDRQHGWADAFELELD